MDFPRQVDSGVRWSPAIFLLLALAAMVSSCGLPVEPVRTPRPSSRPASPTPRPTTVPSRRPTLLPSPTHTARPTRPSTPSPTATPSPTPSAVALSPANTDRYACSPGALFHPHGLVLLGDAAYTIDAGQLVVLSLTQATAVRRFPADGLIEGLPVGEIVFLAPSTDDQTLLLLDKRGDLYRYDPAADRWTIERPIDRRRSAPNPVPLAVASYNDRAYILDTTYSQVWRYPFGDDVPEGYLPGDDPPASRAGTPLDVTRGIDLAVDGDVYILLREGAAKPAALLRFTGRPGQRDPDFAPDLALERPTRLYLDPNGHGPLYVLDQEGHRLQVLERGSGTLLQTITAADIEMRAVWERDGHLYILAPGALYSYPGAGRVYAVTGGDGPDPASRPDDPSRWTVLLGLTSPISDVRYLPERDSLLPGAPRVYRYGIHHGLDMYGGTMGVDVPYGAPVRAAAAGVVVRADHGYRELTPAEWDELAARCAELHMTPPDIENLFRGRQIWIQHADGVVTRYEHLSGIPEEIVTGTQVIAGQVIGFAGNSGTEDGAAGSQSGTHLHFEAYLGEHYLGEGLSLIETRRLLGRLFFP